MESALDNVNTNDYMDPYNIAQLADDTTIIIRLTCQFHLKWVARLICSF